MNNKQFFAEVITGNLSEWTGQCWKWNQTPSFGELLTTQHENSTVYGIVHTISTGSNDPVRIPIAYQKTEAELLGDQPQIFEFLQTNFTCVTVGYQADQKIRYHLPEKPAKIHAFIAPATDQQYAAFFASDQFMHMLFNYSTPNLNIDELLIAIIKQLSKRKLNDRIVQDLLETFSMLHKHDYQKLKVFLNRIQQIL